MDEFGTVLRAWRDRMRPEEAGLPAGPGRRAPGLRREELAALAGVSVEYVVRLEQGRAQHPSPQLLGALARALRLTEAERDHLFRVGGAAVPGPRDVPRHVPPGVQRVVDRLGDVPMAVLSASWDLLRWNPLWAAIGGDPAEVPAAERNVAWKHFTEGHDRMRFDEQHEEDFARDLAADLRDAVGRYPDDRRLAALVARLRAASPDFARRWGEAHVAQHRSSRKTATRTPVGPIELDCDVLTAPGGDLRIVVYTAAPGSEDASKLDLLRVATGSALV
ncbi:helix-turn-helix transcriptional regulator [Amnibacterium setariae]|uniref:XRE family transcriptional regulator n=1 Tax=Amnibacterium setariae TaxID=2306585 RepID=A0A3A1UB25_9MICO|nr:helix-turn-helix transcriptional regulator [Amnibacterium setariae]RIX30526.1 XRE family transcriptional regulator [Amnibacterium setariae]